MKKEILVIVIICLCLHPAITAYNTSLALELGWMSYIAYQKQADIDSWKCSVCSKHPVKNQKSFYSAAGGDIQGFTAFSSTLNAIIIAFRGSADLNNWIADFKTVPVTYPKCSGCVVHDGFYKGYQAVSSLVNRGVQNLKALYSSAPIYITGHSLGGALAVMCGSEISDNYKIEGLYDFGQPRVGNAAFGNYFAPKIPNTYRLIDYADIVPHLPPSGLGFVHSNTQVWYQRGMQSYQLCVAESKQCADSLSVSQYSGGDHSLDNYLKLKVGKVMNSLIHKDGKVKFSEPMDLDGQYDQMRKVLQFQYEILREKLNKKALELEQLKGFIQLRNQIKSQI